jgi:hypothetical protein
MSALHQNSDRLLCVFCNRPLIADSQPADAAIDLAAVSVTVIDFAMNLLQGWASGSEFIGLRRGPAGQIRISTAAQGNSGSGRRTEQGAVALPEAWFERVLLPRWWRT